MAKARSRGRKAPAAIWPKRALALFAAVLIGLVALIMFTGDRTPTPKVGIDLQGGTRITLVPQGGRPTGDQLQQARNIMENRVNGMGVSGARVVTDGDNIVITVPGTEAGQAKAVGKTSQLLFRPVINPAPPTQELPKALQDVANRMVSSGAMTPDEVNAKLAQLVPELKKSQVQGVPDKITATTNPPKQAANSTEEQQQRDNAVKTLRDIRQSKDPNEEQAAAAMLSCDKADPLAGADDPSRPLVTCSPEGPVILGPAPVLDGYEEGPNAPRLTGELIDNNAPITHGVPQGQSQMAVSFKFKTGKDTPGGETWYKLGQQLQGQRVAFTLDSKVISAPQVQEATPPGSATQVTGSFSEAEAASLANNLRYGALPLSFVGENGESGGTATTISPTLGAASLRAGIIAGLVGLALVSLYALWYYRGLGGVAIVSLVASFSLVYAALVLLGRWIGYSLDLAGIAGLIIGIGTTADSFVVYFERIKDEIHQGATFRSAVPRAWRRARKTIVTGNFVSLIAAVILYFLAVGEVKGFAFTLGLTTLFDIFIAFTVTAPLLILLSRKPALAQPRLNGLGSAMRAARRFSGADRREREGEKATGGKKAPGFLERVANGEANLPIVPQRRRWYAALAAVLIGCVLTIALRGFTPGIDFAGGTRISMPPNGEIAESSVSQTFREATGVQPQTVQTVGSGTGRVVEITSERLSDDQITKARSALFDKYQPKNSRGEVNENAINDSTVSESWGKTITNRMLLALGAFLALVFVYIAIRMRWDMALSAIITVLVDLTVVSGIYSLVGFEVSPATVIGLLTILAYSLYDTVVVFDKVHENTTGLFNSTRATYAEQVNLAVNQTIMRSINTSVFSLVPIASLLVIAVGLMGVGTLKDLALVQFIGVIAGTFSSILFAAPLLVTMKARSAAYRRHDEKVRRARAGAGPSERAAQPDAEAADGPRAQEEPERLTDVETAGSKPGRRPEPEEEDADAGARKVSFPRADRGEIGDGRSWRPGM
ncbi:protein translocase subunit SecD [Corynebacterium heidelbergense]|uniref:protein translocase subunit SecD n=1 Tax=Corynebacterium heidelbergense TaxID=2055947 RepID=UPI0015EEF9AF|nr:protein translocase subunit SecD [Corynebacterium heidelbergense]WCZ36628.1 preprotein translocase subunit SecD [Corynebacterium heidelbergense]